MELKGISITKSPNLEDRVRLSGEVLYDDKGYQPEVYWFDFPEKYGEYLSNSGNPWLACLLPLAATFGEALKISKPVDRALFENAQDLMHIWKRWYPHLKVIPIEAELAEPQHSEVHLKTASLFSGGVDSYFTVLRHNNNSGLVTGINIDDLLCIWGFDIPLKNADAFFRMRDVLKSAAQHLGKELIDVATNMRETRWLMSGYGPLSHGAALASVGLALEERYSKILIPGTHAYDNLMPNGSHPLTDPLFSTSRTRIIHDGAGFDRVEKTEFVAKSEIARRSLRVCWESHTDKNCQSCNKCYRTMMTLMLLGALEQCSTFDESNLEMAKIRRIYSKDDNDRSLLREVQALALQKGRADIARAIERSFKYSKRLGLYLRITRSLSTKRFVWRWSTRLERHLLARSLV